MFVLYYQLLNLLSVLFVQKILTHMIDLYTLLCIYAMVPLLEIITKLMKSAQ